MIGSAEFHQFYLKCYGERWSAIYQALVAEETRALRWNRFNGDLPPGDMQPIFSDLKLQSDFYCYRFTDQFRHEVPRGTEGLLQYYVMDLASVIAARALNVQEGDQVLDMCASPGGKTLILAESLQNSGELIANEISEVRRESLKKVIQQYISRSVRDRVWMTGKDGGKFALTHPDKFDRVLVDAPCSGERHLLQTPDKLKEWTKNRSEKLAQRQYALLTAALLTVKPGGKIVYSTCSISPLENDEVIRKLLKKKKDKFKVLPANLVLENAEKTEFGQMMLPDRCGWGPIYVCEIERTS